MCLLSSPRPKAARKSCAIGPRWRIEGAWDLAAQRVRGVRSSRASRLTRSRAVKSRFDARSDRLDHEPPPVARLTPAVGAPVMESTAEMKRAPPVVRAVNVFTPYELMSKLLSSPHTNEPSWVALACLPAAKLSWPAAVFDVPPGIIDAAPLAELLAPPPTAAAISLAELNSPPATVASKPLAELPLPP